MIEKTFRVVRGRENRPLRGLSMGGGQAFTIGLKPHGSVRVGGRVQLGPGERHGVPAGPAPAGISGPARDVNKKLKLLFLSCGTEDPRFPGSSDLLDVLKQHGINMCGTLAGRA